MYSIIRVGYHWPKTKTKEYVTPRSIRRKRKPNKSIQIGRMLTYPVGNGIPFQDITIDYVDPLRGCKYIYIYIYRYLYIYIGGNSWGN